MGKCEWLVSSLSKGSLIHFPVILKNPVLQIHWIPFQNEFSSFAHKDTHFVPVHDYPGLQGKTHFPLLKTVPLGHLLQIPLILEYPGLHMHFPPNQYEFAPHPTQLLPFQLVPDGHFLHDPEIL